MRESTYTLKDWMLGLVAVIAVGVPLILLLSAVLPRLIPAGFPTGPAAGIMAVGVPVFILWTRTRR